MGRGVRYKQVGETKKRVDRIPGVKKWRTNFDVIVGMTGTPNSNCRSDLWAQCYCLDGGKRLGEKWNKFKEEYFTSGGFKGYSLEIKPGAADKIYDAIEDMTFRIETRRKDKAAIRLPQRVVRMPHKVQEQYYRMEREYVIEFEGQEATPTLAVSAGAKHQKLRQIASGFVYADYEEDRPDGQGGVNIVNKRETKWLHNAKTDELMSLCSELQGKQLMIVYHFKAQAEELERKFGRKIEFIGKGRSDAQVSATIKKWNAGKLQYLGLQPQSGGHGLNLQKSGAHHVALLNNPDSAGLYKQVVGRLDREGQVNQVYVHTFLTWDTVDEDRDIMVNSKLVDLQKTLDAIKARQERRGRIRTGE